MSGSTFLLTIIVVAFTVLAFLPERAQGGAICKRHTKINLDDCKHGTAKDYCGNDVCAKGPGDRCGGRSHIHGECGEGMHCKCETCSGCSIYTLECYFSSPTCWPRV